MEGETTFIAPHHALLALLAPHHALLAPHHALLAPHHASQLIALKAMHEE